VNIGGSSVKLFGMPKFCLNYSFGPFFLPKFSSGSSSFFTSQSSFDCLEIDVLWSFSLNYFNRKKDFSSKIDTRIMLVTPRNETIILIHNFNFDEKSNSRNLVRMTKFNHFLKNWNQIETKKTGGST